MSYPFLPVNPCCTDVVINDPCGCSQTLPTNQCGNNLTLSATIAYNGPFLTCITVDPCDTLNIVLQKIDNVICTLISQIDTLVTQVETMSSQIININEEIVIIDNTLDVCCSTTTTTTTVLSCNIYKLASTGPSDFPEDFDWEALECYSGVLIKGNLLTYPASVDTICALENTLVLGSKVVILSTSSCTTTTTTTILI